MRRKGSHLAALVLLLAGGSALFAGCAKKSEQEAMTAVDSTLSGSVSSDVPPPGPTPSQEYTTPPATKSTTTSTPKPKAPSTGSTTSKPSTASSTVTVPAGTSMNVSLVTPLDTKTAATGTEFTATVSEDVMVGGQVAIPAGAEVSGHVAAAARSGKASGRAYMQLAFDQVSFGGKSYNVSAATDTMFGKGGAGKDAAMIGGGAVAGAILGKVLGGNAAKGAVVGGAAGTAASLMTRGPDLHLEAGKKVSLTLDSPVAVTKPKAGA